MSCILHFFGRGGVDPSLLLDITEPPVVVGRVSLFCGVCFQFLGRNFNAPDGGLLEGEP